MKAAIMQPYFFPYLGYFSLIKSVDLFVVYDEIEYTKKGWINRNRVLNNLPIILPLEKSSDFIFINQKKICKTDKLFNKSLNIIKNTYAKAPYFDDVYPILLDCFNFNSNNLFDFLFNSIRLICEYLDIKTKLIVSSTIDYDNKLKSQQKVIAINKKIESQIYINSIGGLKLYDKEIFLKENINLYFLKIKEKEYLQFKNEFEPYLSIIDVLMFNSRDAVNELLNEYELV